MSAGPVSAMAVSGMARRRIFVAASIVLDQGSHRNMKSYAERSCFTPLQIGAWRRAMAWVSRLRSPQRVGALRCHELARAVAHGFRFDRPELVVVDGKCGPVEHSWLIWDSSRSDAGWLQRQGPAVVRRHYASHGAILDVYAPGCVPQVQLIDSLMGIGRYLVGPPREDIRENIIRNLTREMGFRTRLSSGLNK